MDKRLEVVASAIGVHYNTLRAIRDNADSNPTHRVLLALSTYLETTNNG
jgi:hypothetical protein